MTGLIVILILDRYSFFFGYFVTASVDFSGLVSRAVQGGMGSNGTSARSLVHQILKFGPACAIHQALSQARDEISLWLVRKLGRVKQLTRVYVALKRYRKGK